MKQNKLKKKKANKYNSSLIVSFKVRSAINPSFCNSNAIFFERVFLTNANKKFRTFEKVFLQRFDDFLC